MMLISEKKEFKKCSCSSCRDIASGNHAHLFVVWYIPYLLLLTGITVFWFYAEWAGWLWFIGFSWLGTACISNALHCRRKHCIFTGPLYLALGILSVLINLNVLFISWGYIWLAFISGTLLSYIPEWRGQKYFRYNN